MRVSRREQLFDAYEAEELATVVALAELVLESNADDGPVLTRLGAVQSALAQYEIAQQVLERALRVVPETRRHIVLSHLGDLCKHRGDLTGAVRYYEDASRLLPNDATYHIYRGTVLARLGRLTEAESAHRMATSCDEGCIDEAYYNLGLILRSQRRLSEAQCCFEKAIEIDPEYHDAKLALEDVAKALHIIRRTETEQGVGHGAADDADSDG